MNIICIIIQTACLALVYQLWSWSMSISVILLIGESSEIWSPILNLYVMLVLTR